MGKFMFILSSLLSLHLQANSQIIRSPLSFINPRPYNDAIIELQRNIDVPRNFFDVPGNFIDIPRNFIDVPRNFIDVPRNFIDVPRNFIDVPRNFIDVPRNFIDVPRKFIDVSRNFIDVSRTIETPRNVVQQPIITEPAVVPIPNIPSPSTTIITDCTPSVCKNLADTINIMIVSNLLQNTLEDLKNLKVAAASLKNLVSNPALANYPGLISNLVNPNLIGSNFVGSDIIVPSLGPNVVAPRIIASNPVAPNFGGPNVPINNSAMLSNLLKMLGNAV